ncbi:RusA family crossover junction endodeoxyribonuclease [Deinococcus sp. KSM4-11]|uniref:RusA family crossover junction endodeoxyribonuclease n=1 Tax=Deinococcus sp. KSM4-11 TaxID=2568654 RepID=UPI0010A34767|nr:RusA family crossover junction endodeoxyribonuclease [Deinococcus sp. KSM4-11]THF88415.1 RusA family crossover junction endodeoxyribonuclease [Deinococcus sp. KSM4-11]
MNPFPTRDAAEAYLRRIPDAAQRTATRTRLGLEGVPVVHPTPLPAPSAPAPRPAPPLPGILTFALPYPPSVNAIWRAVVITVKGKPTARVLLSQDGRDYRRSVAAVIASLGHPSTPPNARLGLRLHVCPPDHRARDLSNLPKALEDALTHAHVWADDSLIDELRVTRGPVVSGGRVDVVITPLITTLFEGRPTDA